MKDQLPGFILAELFHSSLVVINETTPHEIKLLTEVFAPENKKFFGGYESKIVIFINNSVHNYLSENDLKFLTGILTACKLNLNDVAIFNLNNNAINYADLKNEFHPKFILLFGIDTLKIELPFAIPQYQVQRYDNCTIVSAPALSVLNNSKTEKTKLWNSLQKVFNLK